MTAAARRAVLTYSNAEGAHTISLDRFSVSIGRHPDQDLVLTDNFVSRRHAVLRQTASGCEIEDLGSSHGTYLNGERIRSAPLRSGDVLQFGSPSSMKLRFHIFEEDNPRPSLTDDLLSTLGKISTGARFRRHVFDGVSRELARDLRRIRGDVPVVLELTDGSVVVVPLKAIRIDP